MSVALSGNAVAGRVVVIQESYARGTFSGKVSDMNVQVTGIALDSGESSYGIQTNSLMFRMLQTTSS